MKNVVVIGGGIIGLSMNYTTGNYSIFAEIVCRDIAQLRKVLHDDLQKIKGIERTETFISLEESLHRNVQVTTEE